MSCNCNNSYYNYERRTYNQCESHNKERNTYYCNECKSQNKKKHKCDCYVSCYKTKCGFIQASLTKTASPSFFTTAGQVITYIYTIINTGNVTICHPIRICDDHLGGQIIPTSFILPGASQSFTRTYTILASDLLGPGITNTATAYIEVDKKCWVTTCPSSTIVTFGNADLFGSINQSLVPDAPPGTVEVTVTIINSASSATSAENINLTLPLPPGINEVVPGVPPPTNITSNNVSLILPSLGIGASSTFTFRYLAGSTVTGSSYSFSGIILATTFDPNPTNNFLSSTFVFP